jgi:lysophospholipase L1-like esterase
MADDSYPDIPIGYGIPLVDLATDLLPAPTVDAIREGMVALDEDGLVPDEQMPERLSEPELSATIDSAIAAADIGGVDIRLDALAAGQRLKATLTGNESEAAQGVTVGVMGSTNASDVCSLGTVIFTDAGNLVTISVAHGLAVGDPVTFGTITSTTGVSTGSVYFVRTVPTSTTLTLSATVGGSELGLTTDGTAVAAFRRERAYNRQASVVNPALRVTDTRGVQSNPSFPKYEYIKPDPAVVTYAPGALAGTAMRVETEYAGKYLGIHLRNGGGIAGRIYVDGVLAKTFAAADFSAGSISSGSNGRMPFTFSSYRRRSITIEFDSVSDEFPGFDTEGAYPLIFPTARTKGPRVLVVGDSLTEGVGATSGARNYVRWLGHLMGWRDVWKAGSGSTGYTADGTRLALIDRYANDIVAQQAQIVIIAMGLNDSAETLATVVANAETIWDATLASSYTQELVIVGPWPNGGGSGTISAPLLALDTALAELAVEKGVRYISPIGEGWEFTLYDSTHPDAAGHEYIAWRLAGHLSVPYIAA